MPLVSGACARSRAAVAGAGEADARGRAERCADAQPPLGLLRDQILNERRMLVRRRSELIFGLTYALEAERLFGPAR